MEGLLDFLRNEAIPIRTMFSLLLDLFDNRVVENASFLHVWVCVCLCHWSMLNVVYLLLTFSFNAISSVVPDYRLTGPSRQE